MGEEMREQINKVKNWKQFNEGYVNSVNLEKYIQELIETKSKINVLTGDDEDNLKFYELRKTKDFPRDFKYSLGDKIRTECIELVVFIYKANSSVNRQQFLAQILERIQAIELMLRLSKDLRLINVDSFSETVVLTDSLARQTQGWLKHSKGLGAE